MCRHAGKLVSNKGQTRQTTQGAGEKEGDRMKTMYRGIVKDQLKVLETRKTREYSTYKDAHDAAEKLCKKTYGDRGIVDVEEVLGRWWNGDQELIRKNGEVYALNGWNGESYTDSWKCLGADYMEASQESYTITPIYDEMGDVVDYGISRN